MTGPSNERRYRRPVPDSFNERDSPNFRVLVVVPAFNEEGSVGQVVAEINRCIPDADVLVVDDSSLDATRARALEQNAEVLTLPFNLGVGGAMRAGFRYAQRNGYQCVVQVDADGQHDPSEIQALVDALQDADLVIGARFAGRGSYDVRGPRRWAMKLLSVTLSRMAKTELSDTTSGFRASGPKAVALFALYYPAEYLGDTIESTVISARAGLRIRQMPVHMRIRAAGRPSQTPWRATLYLLRAVIALGFAGVRWRSKRAVQAVELGLRGNTEKTS